MTTGTPTHTGKIKWYNTDKGYGFITPDDATKDIFVHHNILDKAGITNLQEGQAVRFTVTTDDKTDRKSASSIASL